MGLDIRWPIGLMFTLIGVLLTAYGAIKSAASTIQVNGQSVDINFIWGIVLLVFGVAMLLGAISGKKNLPTPQSKGKNLIGFKSVTIFSVVFAILAACFYFSHTFDLSGQGEQLLRQQIDSESQGQIKLVSFKKTDGQMSVVNAVKIYELDYEAEIAFQADGTWFKGMQGMGFDFSTQQAAQGSMAAFANQTVNGGIAVHRGDHVKIAGAMQGEKKESGWVFEMGDSHVVSN